MEALRQIIHTNENTISLELPKEFKKSSTYEVIILSIDENTIKEESKEYDPFDWDVNSSDLSVISLKSLDKIEKGQ